MTHGSRTEVSNTVTRHKRVVLFRGSHSPRLFSTRSSKLILGVDLCFSSWNLISYHNSYVIIQHPQSPHGGNFKRRVNKPTIDISDGVIYDARV